MRQYFLTTIFLFFLFIADAQPNLDHFVNVYNQKTLVNAKKTLQGIPNFKLKDSLMTDTIVGKTTEGQIIAYLKHSKTNLEFSFTSENLYKKLYKQAENKFIYTNDYARGTRGNGTSRHTTSFSNYEGAKIGSLDVLLVVVTSTITEKVIQYELNLFPYYED
jgi:hypothetical protein